MMTDYKKKFYLFKQSMNFCSVPWNYIKIGTQGEVSTCSHATKRLGNLHENGIEQILSSNELKQIKTNLYNDQKDLNCSSCVSMGNAEEVEYNFLRGHYNSIFQKVSLDYSDNTDFVLSGVDLHWGSTCNLKCITCWPPQSSSIAQELGVPISTVSVEAADNFIDYIIQNQSTLREVYISGGEPTLIKHNLRLLQQLDKNTDCMFRVNTNMMFDLDNLIIQELKKFSNVMFTISADSVIPERFNYIRRGASWDKFISNLNALLDLHFSWRVNSVFFVGSALYLPELHEFFTAEFGITDFTINQVTMGHSELEARNLHSDLKQTIIDKFLLHREKYKSNRNLYGQLTNCLKELEKPVEQDYRAFFEQTDIRAKTNWQEIFKELV